MNTEVRRKLAMAVRVRDFSRAHPTDAELHTTTLARLEDRIARAQALDNQQRQGYATVKALGASKAALRKTVRDDYLRHLTRMAAAAAVEDPALPHRFRLPVKSASHQVFLTAAQTTAAAATAQRELFLRYGMAATFVDDLNGALQAYEQAVTGAHAGTAAHVGARADLDAVTAEIMQLVQQLDAVNRYRFREEPELLAAWDSARNIPWPIPEEEEAPKPAPNAVPA